MSDTPKITPETPTPVTSPIDQPTPTVAKPAETGSDQAQPVEVAKA